MKVVLVNTELTRRACLLVVLGCYGGRRPTLLNEAVLRPTRRCILKLEIDVIICQRVMLVTTVGNKVNVELTRRQRGRRGCI